MRMSLRAISVADIASISGLTINHLAWELREGNSLREHYDWPRNPRHSQKHRKIYGKKPYQKPFSCHIPSANPENYPNLSQYGNHQPSWKTGNTFTTKVKTAFTESTTTHGRSTVTTAEACETGNLTYYSTIAHACNSLQTSISTD